MMLAITAPGAQATEPMFGEVLKTIGEEISSDGGSIDDVIEHYGGAPPAAKEIEIDRVLGEISSLNEKYGGRAVSGSGTLSQDLNELGMSSDTTMQGYLEHSSNALTVREDAVSIDEGEAAAVEDGATTTAVGGELGDFADLAGIDSAIETAGPLIAFDPLAAVAAGVIIAGGEYLALYGRDGEEKELVASAVEAERWLRVQPGEHIYQAFEAAFGTGSYGPGADGPPANWWYEGSGIEVAPAGRPLYVLIFRAPCAFGAPCTSRWYEGSASYRIVSLLQPGGECKGAEAAVCVPEESGFVSKPALGLGAGPGAYWHPDAEPSCGEAPFEDAEIAGWPPHFLRHHIDYWQDKSWDTALEGCGLYTKKELTEPPFPAQRWDYQRLQGLRIVASQADLDLGFPRSTNSTGLTPESISVTPTEGNTGVTNAITGQAGGNESDRGAEKFLDHNEHAHTAPKDTIPLVPGVATELAKVLIEKNTSLKELVSEEELTDEQVEDIAEECVQDLVADGDSEAEGVGACETEPIFLSGSDVPAATEHDLRAINPLEGGKPSWVKLNYESATGKEERGEKRNWYVGLGGCSATKPAGKQCDEYPFFASKQGGPGALVTPSLEYINETDNEKQGSRYGGFVTSCKMSERAATEYTFLSVPLEPSLKIPTIYVCN